MKRPFRSAVMISILSVCLGACGRANSEAEGQSAETGGTAAEKVGSGGGTQQTGGTDGQNTSPVSFSATSVSTLPACNDSRRGALGYVKNEKKFYSCDGFTWLFEDMGAEDDFDVVGKWKFHVDSFIGEPNISSEALELAVKIADIEVVKYRNGSVFYTLSGLYSDTSSPPIENVTDHVHLYASAFSYSGIIADSSKSYSKIFKMTTYENSRLRVKMNFSNPTPTFMAVVDINGNFNDNIDSVYTLTSDVP